MITNVLNWARQRRPGLVLPGALVSVLCALAALSPASALALNHGFTGSFGSATSTPANPEPLSGPAGVAVNEIGATKGDVYVVDKGNNRVEYFSSTGTYIGQFNGTEIDGVAAGAGKEAPAKFSEPEGIAVDNDVSSPSHGDMYVVDASQGVVDKFSATGEYISQLTGFASTVFGVAVDPSGNVWVAEGGKEEENGVREFSDGVANTLLTSFTPEFGRSRGIAVDSEDNLYLLRGAPNVAKFSKEGAPIEGEVTTCECVRGLAIDPATNELFVDQESLVAQYGPFGKPYREPEHKFGRSEVLVDGSGIAVDGATGIVYVADAGKNDVDTFGFGSPPSAPETLPASGETPATAVLHGKLKPPATQLGYDFEYNAGASCTGGTKTTAKEGEGEVIEEVTGLEPSAEYTFCMSAENEFGLALGAPEHFETKGVPPTAKTEGVTEITHDSATLHGEVDPVNQKTTYEFEISKKESFEEVIAVGGSSSIPPRQLGDQPVSVATGPVLAPETTYYYRLVAKNETGSGPAPNHGSFTTAPPLPTVTTEGASQITAASASLAGSVLPGSSGPNSDAKWYFQYGTSSAYDQQAPVAPGDVGMGFNPIPVATTLSGLASNTTYHFRLLASNANSDPGVSPQPAYGVDRTFTTAPLQPFPGESSHLSETAATLSGDIDPDGHALEYRFEYGTSTAYGQRTPISPGTETDEYTTVTAPVSGLAAGIPYHYRVVAIGPGGEAYSSDATFMLYPPAPGQTGNPFAPGQSTPATFPTFPLLGTPTFPPPPTETVTPPKPLTKAQRLAKALMSCRKDKPKTQRTKCEKQAQKRYGTKAKAKKSAKPGGRS
jgi:hypothetical protein